MMLRCLQLAQNGFGNTYPNPLVGCVITFEDKIIGEGWHQKAGTPHAEVQAINAVSDKKLLKEATLYVNLEPCAHFGRTPPCADLIIAHNIPRVCIGAVDSHTKVAGKGIEKLLQAGISVKTGILEKECRILNKRFYTFHEKKRPFILLKWAVTKDGYIAPLQQMGNRPTWISNSLSKQISHKFRTEEQAILVGTETAKKDNSQLTARDWFGQNPIRLLIDRRNEVPKTAAIFSTDAPTFVFNETKNTSEGNVQFVKLPFEGNIPEQIVSFLYQKDIQSVLIEGGAKTLQSFINAQLWDEAHIF